MSLTRTTGKFFRLTLTLLLALSLTLGLAGGISKAYADDDNDIENGISGSENSPARAVLTKTLHVPVGTELPNGNAGIEYVFEFKRQDNSTLGAKASDTPILEDVKVTIRNSDLSDTDACKTVGNVNVINKESDDLFKSGNFKHAGVYFYELTEKQFSAYSIATGSNETMYFSQAKYTLAVFVANPTGTTANNKPWIKTIVVDRLLRDDGKPDNGGGTTTGLGKVDPTPGGSGSGDTDKFSDLTFTNSYSRHGVEDPDSAKGTLPIAKTVDGEFGDRSLYFDFTTTITNPAVLLGSAAILKGYVYDGTTRLSDLSANSASDSPTIANDASYGPYFAIESGKPFGYKLKHGQKLVITGVSIGTEHSVTEAGVSYYEPAADVLAGGVKTPYTKLSAGSSLSTAKTLIAVNGDGDLINSVAYINKRSDVSPTGIAVADLPFYGMIALAAAALVLFVVVKSRKRHPQNSDTAEL